MKGISLKPKTFVDARGKSDEMKLEEASSLHDYLSNFILADEFLKSKVPMREFLLEGLIPKRSISIINGGRGVGKSWLSLSIANEVVWGGQVGPWKVTNPVDVVLVDAEMEVSIIHERLEMLNVGRNLKDAPCSLYLYMEGQAWEKGLKRTSILDTSWRKCILDVMREHTDVGLLILDNLASLAPGIDENDKMAFDIVNRWLLELRFMGVSVIMIHHLGKSGIQRGTSAHEDHVDLAINLTGKEGDQLCRFKCEISKDRTCATKGKKWRMELVENEDGRLVFASQEFGDEISLQPKVQKVLGRTPRDKVARVVKFMIESPHASNAEIAKACGVSRNRLEKYKKILEKD